jgi:hypothetical protein
MERRRFIEVSAGHRWPLLCIHHRSRWPHLLPAWRHERRHAADSRTAAEVADQHWEARDSTEPAPLAAGQLINYRCKNCSESRAERRLRQSSVA